MFIRVCYGQGMFGVCFMFLFSFCVCRLSKVARRSSGVHLFVLITNLVCVGVTLLRGAPVYFLGFFGFFGIFLDFWGFLGISWDFLGFLGIS